MLLFWKKKQPNGETAAADNLIKHREYEAGEFIGGEYKILDRFAGGMGYVYLVQHRELELPIVLKTLKEPGDSGARAAFNREIETWIGLGRHPNIVQAIFYRSLDGLPFIAAEYVRPQSGGYNSISDYINIDVNPQTVLKWGIQFCDGLEYANENGLLAHRDIKPANLLVDDSGNLKISDFGLARLSQSPSGKTESASERSAIAGTIPFMAPEQFLSPLDLDIRVDIWAFGIVLRLLLGGGYPFNGSSEEGLIFSILNDSPNNQNHFLGDICDKCLSKNRNERFHSPKELRDALRSAGLKHKLQVEGWDVRFSDECESLFAKVLAHRELGNIALAQRFLSELLQQFPSDYRGWNEQGRLLLESKRFEEAMESFHTSLKLNPFNTRTWNNLGITLKALQKLDEAEDAFKRAISHDPLNTGAMLNLSSVHAARGKPIAAIQLLENAIKIAPDKAALWVNLGASQMDIGAFAQAKRSFERSLKLHPGLHEAEENLRILNEAAKRQTGRESENVGLLIQKGKFSEAREILLARVSEDPTNKNGLHNLGVIALQCNRLTEALHWFQKVIAIDCQEEFAITQVVKIKCQLNEYESALEYCTLLSQIPNCEIKEVSLRSQILRALGQESQAIDCLKAAIGKYPQADTLWFMLADCLKDYGHVRESLSAAQQCLQLLVQSGGNSDNIIMVKQLIDQLRQPQQ
jgi:serine/threonine protein kinase